MTPPDVDLIPSLSAPSASDASGAQPAGGMTVAAVAATALAVEPLPLPLPLAPLPEPTSLPPTAQTPAHQVEPPATGAPVVIAFPAAKAPNSPSKKARRAVESAAPAKGPDWQVGARHLPLTLSVESVRGVAELTRRLAAWSELAASAAEPNPFYEPFMMLPALAHLGDAADIELLFIHGADPRPGQPSVLCGVVPLERRSRFRGLPIASRALWQYRHCYSCAPLFRRGYVGPAVAALLDYLARDAAAGGPPLTELRWIPGEGEIHQQLTHAIKERDLETQVTDTFTRAILRPEATADTYVQKAISGGRQKELRRLDRRLAETGSVVISSLEPGADPGPWIDEFLALEASGWKRDVGTALAITDGDRRFFEEVVRAAAAEGRLMMMALRLDGRALAMRCSFRSQHGAAAFRIAYDESYHRFSPGVLLELANIRRVHETGGLRFMDSCAHWQHPMINHVWSDRTTLQTLIVATGGGHLASAAVAAYPLLRWLRNRVHRGGSSDAPGSRAALGKRAGTATSTEKGDAR